MSHPSFVSYTTPYSPPPLHPLCRDLPAAAFPPSVSTSSNISPYCGQTAPPPAPFLLFLSFPLLGRDLSRCNLSAPLPPLSGLTSLRKMDLSANRLSGALPRGNYGGLATM